MDYEPIPLTETSPVYDRTPFISYARRQAAAKADQMPGIGDAVHYWDADAVKCRAATVADLVFEASGDYSVCLGVIDPDEGQLVVLHAIPHKERKQGMSWHWPEAV